RDALWHFTVVQSWDPADPVATSPEAAQSYIVNHKHANRPPTSNHTGRRRRVSERGRCL
ncbi:hypothetical protein M440DRAFT_1401469, partial [Trichoderma longibrachiatum ATCC 18648]